LEKGTKRPKKIKISNIIISAILLVIIAFIVVLFAGRITKKTTFLFGYTMVWVMTGSMETEIPQQSYILVESVSPEEVQVGDVIMFYSDDPALEGAINTHRVIEILNDGFEFVTKGDNNPSADAYTAKSFKVIARYVCVLPVMSTLMRLFLKPIGLLIVIIVVLLMTAFLFVPDFVKALKEVNTENETAEKAYLIDRERRIQEEIERLRGGGQKPKDD